MIPDRIFEGKRELSVLCARVRELVDKKEYTKCENLIAEAMQTHPHAPEPHNLIGILLEKQGDHLTAMKHFRAAWALDPSYLPTRLNLSTYGTLFSTGRCAFDESDCREEMR